MEYLVLRNCFTAGCLYFKKGDVVDLPDEMYKYEKNFKLVRDAPESTIEPIKDNVCPACGRECKTAFGLQAHMRVHK